MTTTPDCWLPPCFVYVVTVVIILLALALELPTRVSAAGAIFF